jgi:hypothetical protein
MYPPWGRGWGIWGRVRIWRGGDCGRHKPGDLRIILGGERLPGRQQKDPVRNTDLALPGCDTIAGLGLGMPALGPEGKLQLTRKVQIIRLAPKVMK